MTCPTRTLLPLLFLLAPAPAAIAQPLCVGDCDGDGAVHVNELVMGVRVELGDEELSVCPAIDCNVVHFPRDVIIIGEDFPPISCLITAVGNSLEGCRLPTPTATPGGDECHVGCFERCFPFAGSDCPCPLTCGEFPTAHGRQCAASICFESDEQVARCVKALDEEGLANCYDVGE